MFIYRYNYLFSLAFFSYERIFCCFCGILLFVDIKLDFSMVRSHCSRLSVLALTAFMELWYGCWGVFKLNRNYAGSQFQVHGSGLESDEGWAVWRYWGLAIGMRINSERVPFAQRIKKCLRAGQTNICCCSWIHQLSQDIWSAQGNKPWTVNLEPDNLSSYTLRADRL